MHKSQCNFRNIVNIKLSNKLHKYFYTLIKYLNVSKRNDPFTGEFKFNKIN